MSLKAYINDASLVGQFQYYNSEDAIIVMREIVSFLKNSNCCSVFWNKGPLYAAMVEYNKTFASVIDSNRDLRMYWKKLECALVSDVVGEAVNDIQTNKDAGLISFPGAFFVEPTTTCGASNIAVPVYLSEETVSKHLYAKQYIREYSQDARYSPRDQQTVLVNPALFIPTNRDNHRRRLYERVGTDELWCVDNQHYGLDAEFEVFRKSDETHIGTCGLNGNIDAIIPSTKRGRHIESYWS